MIDLQIEESKQWKVSIEHDQVSESKLAEINNPKISQYRAMYCAFFQGREELDVDKLMNQSIKKLSDHGIRYCRESFCPEVSIAFSSHTENWGVVNILVNFSYFTFDILLLNFSHCSPMIQGLNQMCCGSMGKILLCEPPGQDKFVVKSIKYAKASNRASPEQEDAWLEKNLRDAIKQYCLNKLCSALSIGPKVHDYLGFDLLVFSQTVQFSLQFCCPLNNIEKYPFDEYLQILHSLHIIHGDIKPENTMWSNSFNKPVLIDFGLARVVKQNVGLHSLTNYFGTYTYCLEQMKQLLLKQSFGQVDLYYNDVNCLLKSIRPPPFKISLSQLKNKSEEQDCYINITRHVQNFLKNLQLQRIIYDRNQQKVEKFLSQNKKMEVSEHVISLLQNLKQSNSLIKILLLLEGNSSIESRINMLKQYHSGKIVSINSNQGKCENYEMRFRENVRGNQMSMTGTMLYLYLFYDSDITPKARYRQKNIKQQLKCFRNQDTYWRLVVEFASNLFTTKKELIQLFNFLQAKLQINDEQPCEDCQLLVFIKASRILLKLKKDHSIDLDMLSREHTQQQRKISGKFIQEKLLTQIQYFQIWLKTSNATLNYNHLYNQTFREKIKYFRRSKRGGEMIQKLFLNFENRKGDDYLQEETKFTEQCQNIEAASKSLYFQLKLEEKQILCYDMRNGHTQYFQFLRQKCKVSINRCLQKETSFEFCYQNYLGMHLISSNTCLTIVKAGLQKLKQYTEQLFSNEIFQALSLSLYKTLTKCQFYVPKYKKSDIYRVLQSFYINLAKKADQLNILTRPRILACLFFIYENFATVLAKEELIDFADLVLLAKKYQQIRYDTIQWKYVIACYISRTKLLFNMGYIDIYEKISILRDVQQKCKVKNFKGSSPVKLYIQTLLNCLASGIEGQREAACIQQIVFDQRPENRSHLIKYIRLIDLCPTMAMYYFTKPAEYFPRAFKFVSFFVEKYHQLQMRGKECQFCFYIFLRNCAWPSISSGNAVWAAESYLRSIYQMRRAYKSQNFNKSFGNLLPILQIILSAIHTFRLYGQSAFLMERVLVQVVHLQKYSCSFFQRQLDNKFYTIYLALSENRVVGRQKERRLRLYRIRQFRNSQYPLELDKMNRIIPKYNNTRWKSRRQAETQCICLIKSKMQRWNTNKELKLDVHEASLGFKFILMFRELANQTDIESSATVKELSVGYLEAFHHHQ